MTRPTYREFAEQSQELSAGTTLTDFAIRANKMEQQRDVWREAFLGLVEETLLHSQRPVWSSEIEFIFDRAYDRVTGASNDGSP